MWFEQTSNRSKRDSLFVCYWIVAHCWHSILFTKLWHSFYCLYVYNGFVLVIVLVTTFDFIKFEYNRDHKIFIYLIGLCLNLQGIIYESV
jgi:hypothetical protein